MIDYEQQIIKFVKITSVVKISCHAQTLYLHLLTEFRHKFFPKELKVDNKLLYSATGLSRKQLCCARVELQQLNLLYYNKGAGSSSGTYIIIDLSQNRIQDICADIKDIKIPKEPKIANLTDFSKQFDNLPEEDRFYGQFVCNVLYKALQKQQTGVFANSYATAQTFLTASNELTLPVVYKLIITLKNKPDIQDKTAYTLAVLANFAQAYRKKQKGEIR